MRKTKMILMLVLFSTMCCNCSTSSHLPKKVRKVFDYKNLNFTDRCMQHNTNRAIRKSIKRSDTLYLYSVAFSNREILWFHSDNYIYSCVIYPHKIHWRKPVEANNYSVDSISFHHYTETIFHRVLPCFEDALDGEAVYVIVRGEKRSCSVNTACLFSQDFPVGSFPFKLQYDLSKVLSNCNK